MIRKPEILVLLCIFIYLAALTDRKAIRCTRIKVLSLQIMRYSIHDARTPVIMHLVKFFNEAREEVDRILRTHQPLPLDEDMERELERIRKKAQEKEGF